MPAITLTLIVHDHQPLGNFDHVIERACDDAYQPFVAFLERHPRVRLAIHTSGPLLEWLAVHRREYLSRLRALVRRGQVEPWGGGFYEPVLPGIPEIDRQGQILRMSDWIEEELGVRPRGLWLTERVWEPALAATLADAGIAVTALDDAHFLAAGLESGQLWGPYWTEDQGRGLRVLPIRRELRYRIPFEPPGRTIEWLRGAAEEGAGRLAVLGDDGEKFGLWPGTRATCWKEGWLDRLAEAIEAEPWIEWLTPSEAIERHAPLGLAYLPSASYHEMQEWSLPPAAQRRYHEAERSLAEVAGDGARDLLRGGHWRGFMMRYPESNRLHKRMLRASRRLHAVVDRDRAWKEARTRLWRAQCNCPYWHGVFGGLYLPHLREAVYRELIAVERWVAPGLPHVEFGDFDLDGDDDALIETHDWAAWVSARGGALWALDDRRRGRNWGDTLARRPEAYHEALEQALVGGGEGASIHRAIRSREAGLSDLAKRQDERPRDMFLERWIDAGKEAGGAELGKSAGAALRAGGPAGVPGTFSYSSERFRFVESGSHEIVLAFPEGDAPGMLKRYRVDERGALTAGIELSSSRARSGSLEVTLGLGVHVPEAPDRFMCVNGARARPAHFAARSSHDRVRELSLVDLCDRTKLDVTIDRDARLERDPIETVSLSEAGAERVFQGLEARFSFDVAIEPGASWSVQFTLSPGGAME